MDLKRVIASFAGGDEERAVSPVIGVILMVAITVILAAVIGTFVLGLGDRVSQASPNANFEFDYTAGNNNAVDITHDGGAGVESDQLNVTVGGSDVWGGQDDWSTSGITVNDDWDGKITAGSSLSLEDTDGSYINDGDTVKIIWTASGSDKTAVIGESEVDL
ncbi:MULTISPECIES: type IV pilin [Halorussus]|uniref:type IV pilin n=1 Tax=Halorussus TaxID=1070314 RepID=UPI000E219C4A|nr:MULTISPECIES: type IV pilin N-terminal domain-containing protein [Halorussus]NHN58814.1 type IV pilin [Halorussus sp. JP-T4]